MNENEEISDNNLPDEKAKDENEAISHHNLSDEKVKYEIEKLKQEIEHLKRPLIKNPQYLAPIITIILAFLTIGYSFFSGFWDVQMKKLENTKLVLQIDIDKFQRQKDTLDKEITNTRKEKVLLLLQNKKLKIQSESMIKSFKEISIKYELEKKEISKELLEVDVLISANKCGEAFTKLRAVVTKLNHWENKQYNPFDFDPNDFN